MWAFDTFDNIVNLDYVKGVYICQREEIEVLGMVDLKKYVVVAADVTMNGRLPLASFDTAKEARDYIINLKYDLEGK